MISGIDAIRALLASDGTLTALVPVARIGAGPLPQNSSLPAISLQSISKIDRNILSAGTKRFVRERVQVTVMAYDYPSQQQVLAAVRHAAADKFPAISGLELVSVHTDSAGPDGMNEDPAAFVGIQDFIVEFNELR